MIECSSRKWCVYVMMIRYFCLYINLSFYMRNNLRNFLWIVKCPILCYIQIKSSISFILISLIENHMQLSANRRIHLFFVSEIESSPNFVAKCLLLLLLLFQMKWANSGCEIAFESIFKRPYMKWNVNTRICAYAVTFDQFANHFCLFVCVCNCCGNSLLSA